MAFNCNDYIIHEHLITYTTYHMMRNRRAFDHIYNLSHDEKSTTIKIQHSKPCIVDTSAGRLN